MPVPMRSGEPPALPPEMASLYVYPAEPLEAEILSSHERSGYRIQRLTLHPHSIRIDWYQPTKAGKHPAVLLSPILAGNDLYVQEFAKFYAARGLHALIVYRPHEVFSADKDLGAIENHFRESVIGLRRAIDWLETQPTVDSEQIGSFGISLGAILTTLLAAVEPRVDAHILGLPAGEVAEIIMSSKDKAIRKRRKAYLERHGWDMEKGLAELERAIESEPIRFAPYVDPEEVLIIVGLFDRVVGSSRSLKLWRAIGRPRLIVLPTGHYTAVAATPYLKIATYSFLRRRFVRSTR